MLRIRSFAPIADRNSEMLILGSMPGRASLAAGEYYAHPQNAFWKILCELLVQDATAGYAERVNALRAARIALWDVLQSCVREGSLDAGIQTDSQLANDFVRFFRSHPKIQRIFFNGATAEQVFRKLVQPGIDVSAMTLTRLPSTSPAHAAMSYAQKRDAWLSMLRTSLSPALAE